VRLAAIALTGVSRPGFGDAAPYVFAAREIAEHGSYPDRTEPFFFRAPAYPLFLAAATLGRPESVARAKTANAALGSAAAVLLAALSARIFRNRRLAIATGAAAAVFPSLVYVSSDVQSEPLFLDFLLLSALALLAAADRRSRGAAWAAGLCLGLAALTRPSALALAPLLAAPVFDRRGAGGGRLGLALCALGGVVLALAPWTIRNEIRFHELIPVTDAGGVSLYAGNSSWTGRFYAIESREEYRRWLEDFDRDLRARLARIEAGGATSPERRSAGFARMAIEESLADPGASARLVVQKAWHWLRPYPTTWFWPPAIVVGVGVLYAALYALALRGFLRADRRGVAAFALAVLAISMAAHVVLQVVWRYRVPYWDPILLIYGVAGAAGARTAGARPR
jgi:4-amino-4-deoxy-L-arabinose transferase-like glycosyltransferase